tara:strand:- start:267 stop:533 length:267 start_codon:yes stop_codon:yes gene_type:complete
MNDLGLLDALKNHIGIYNLDLPQHLRNEIEEFMEKTKILKLKRKPATRKIRKKQIKISNFTRKKMRRRTARHHKKGKKDKTRKKKNVE